MKKIITLIFLLIFTSQCGFKVIKQSELQDFYISEIETIGDRKINFDLKNKLSFMKKVGNKKRLKLNIITTKTNSIKEKNSSNHSLESIERIIELEIKDEMISMSGAEPIQLFSNSDASRNWEGIVRYGKDSFLIVTDKYPRMILGLVENN